MSSGPPSIGQIHTSCLLNRLATRSGITAHFFPFNISIFHIPINIRRTPRLKFNAAGVPSGHHFFQYSRHQIKSNAVHCADSQKRTFLSSRYLLRLPVKCQQAFRDRNEFFSILCKFHASLTASTILSQFFSAICCFLYLRDTYPGLLCRREDIGAHKDLMIHTLRYGLISALQASSLYIGKILVQGSVNTLGTPGIAAYTAATRIEGFANSFGDSGGNAVSVMVSQNLGAGNHDRVKKSLFWGLMLNWTVCVVISLFMFFGSDPALQLFLSSSDELALYYGNSYIRLISVFYIFCFTGSAYMGYFKGQGYMVIAFCGTLPVLGHQIMFDYGFLV